jgi:signal transduction histidine kinase
MAALQTSLMGLKEGRWLPRDQFNLPQRIYMSAAGGPGQLWLSHNDGGLTLYDNGKSTRYDISAVGLETGIFPGPQLVVGGERGIVVLRDNRFVQLGPLNAEALRTVSGMAVTPDGDRWLNGARGLVHIRRSDWENSVRQPSVPLVYELIDALEGYPGRAAVGNRQTSVYNMGNGVLWLRATGGLVRLDTTALRTNTVKPIVQLLRVNTDKGAHPAAAVLRLPPDSRNFNIQYTAPGLRKPEGMQFQYKLEGVDRQWQDAGTRRAAYYTNVGPGSYRFSVRAANEDGMASDAVASMQIEIAPTVVQTWWFQLLCLILALLALYGAWQYRLKKATAAIAGQLQVRMDERERIARTLHDTFLQSVQALVLRVYAVLTKLPEGSEPRTRLEAILDEADRAIDEGRDQVQQLRTGLDIAQQLRMCGVNLAALHEGTGFELMIDGTARPLSPPVQEELCAIAQEALRNAFQHAQASMVTTRIAYGDDSLLLTVADNGRGLDDEEVRQRAKDRHFGLVGMRERARRVGATLDIGGASGQGTVVELKVLARLAYAAAA